MGLLEIKALRGQVQLREADLAVASAEFQRALVRLFIEAGEDIQTTSLCLECGAFVPKETGCDCKK